MEQVQDASLESTGTVAIDEYPSGNNSAGGAEPLLTFGNEDRTEYARTSGASDRDRDGFRLWPVPAPLVGHSTASPVFANREGSRRLETALALHPVAIGGQSLEFRPDDNMDAHSAASNTRETWRGSHLSRSDEHFPRINSDVGEPSRGFSIAAAARAGFQDNSRRITGMTPSGSTSGLR